ncbi:MAG: hypothetical protein JWR63_4562 [Conexibacter sp.]|nr:hypothetical protein [Conexibacter sp.]
MEPGSIRPARPVDNGPSAVTLIREGFGGPTRSTLRSAGEFAVFCLRAIGEVPKTYRYAAEVLRQVGLLITGTVLLIAFMTFLIGTMCGTESVYTLRGYGATSYAGAFTVLCGTRDLAPYMLCYVLAAKVGAGWVAEIGSMRINDEIDALETAGISPMLYLVGVRLAAAWLAFPMFALIALGCTNLGSFVVVIWQLGGVSQGGWEQVHWALQSPLDILFVLIKSMVMSTVIALAALFFGYRASGGPVGVGTATANSMVFNMVVVNITATTMTMVFWGLDARLPIGG